MSQQINLYQQQFHPRRVVLPLAGIIAASLALVLLLGSISVFYSMQRGELRKRVARLESSRQVAEQQLAQLEATVGRLQPNRLLESKVLRLDRDLKSRQRILAQLRQDSGPGADGFSAHLEGLARQHLDGTWLTRLDIRGAGRGLTLGGKALQADLVPMYMQRLGEEQVFQGISLQVMNLQQPDDAGAPVQFELRTRIKAEDQ